MREAARAFREGWQTGRYMDDATLDRARRGVKWATNRVRERIAFKAAPWLLSTDLQESMRR